jgi:hypothetical protein
LERFEEYMTDRQDWDALRIVAEPVQQLASASLLCVRVNELDATKATLPLISDLTHAMLDRWLSGDAAEGVPGVFERMEQELGVHMREPDGSLVAVNSHDCRRLFVTNAYAAGASDLDIMRWQGREHAGDLPTYDRRSLNEKLAALKAAIRDGRVEGQLRQAYVQLAPEERDAWLDGQVGGLHVTPLGLCAHDYSATPCVKALNCLNRCRDFLHDPADADQRHALEQLERRTRDAIAVMEQQGKNVVSAWLEQTRATLATVQELLHLDPTQHAGLVQPFVSRPSLYAPVRGGEA